jgi:hypothetical protein
MAGIILKYSFKKYDVGVDYIALLQNRKKVLGFCANRIKYLK